jgi:hypothetical protein
VKAFARFWVDFVVGDDWTVAVGVVVVLGGAALLADSGGGGWLWAALGLTALLLFTVWRAVRAHDHT